MVTKKGRLRRYYIIILMLTIIIAIVVYGVERVMRQGLPYFEEYVRLVRPSVIAFAYGVATWVTGQVLDASSFMAAHRKKNKIEEGDY